MIRSARWAYVVLAWAYVLGLAVQVFYAGLGIFGPPASLAVHVNLGWMLHLAPILIVAAAALSRAGRRHWGWALALAAVVFVVPIFVLARDSSSVIAALHPVAAAVAFWLAIVVARQSLEALRGSDVRPETSEPAAVVA